MADAEVGGRSDHASTMTIGAGPRPGRASGPTRPQIQHRINGRNRRPPKCRPKNEPAHRRRRRLAFRRRITASVELWWESLMMAIRALSVGERSMCMAWTSLEAEKNSLSVSRQDSEPDRRRGRFARWAICRNRRGHSRRETARCHERKGHRSVLAQRQTSDHHVAFSQDGTQLVALGPSITTSK